MLLLCLEMIPSFANTLLAHLPKVYFYDQKLAIDSNTNKGQGCETLKFVLLTSCVNHFHHYVTCVSYYHHTGLGNARLSD